MKTLSSNTYEPIVIISNAISGGGAEKSMLTLHKGLISKGINSHLIALNKSTVGKFVKNVHVLERNWRDSFQSTLSNFKSFKRQIKYINPRTIIVNCELPELYISLLSNKNRKVICVEHTTKPWLKKLFLGACVRFLLRIKRVLWVTVIKNENKIWFSKSASRYIPNSCMGIINVRRNSSALPCLVFIGGLKNNKRPTWVIEAGIRCNLVVHIYGEGPLKTFLEKKYAIVSHKVKFHGFKPNVWSLVPSNSLVVVPSEFEGDGMVVVEAALSQLPLVLAKNDDLIRFSFEKKHYFQDLDELHNIIEQNKSSNFENLKVRNLDRTSLKKERSLSLIATEWIKFLEEPN